MRTIDTLEDLQCDLSALLELDPCLRPAAEVAGGLPLRRTEPGFASLSSIIVSQQVSKASADAIFRRLEALDVLHDAALFALQEPERLLGAGLSRPKLKTLLAAAHACSNGGLDLHGLCHLPADQAIATLTAISGIGPWTAEVYLLFAAGHPDIFPSGDIALQNAWQMIFGTPTRPTAKELAASAQIWSPWRGTAARLLWAYYGVKRGLNGKTPV
ncbi:MAG: DNA-3-methyladenine glycosylase 2 family protein [Rhizobiaceae bacterium]